MDTAAAFHPTRPAHVPDELVYPYPFAAQGTTIAVHPRSLLAEIHSRPPVIWADNGHHGMGGAWVPRRCADIQQVYMDTENFTPRSSPFAMFVGEEWFPIPAEADPPLHALYRHALNPMFAPSRIAPLESKIRHYARTRLEALEPRGECEFVSEFAFEFPIRVFLELMGLPQERMSQFLAWEHAIIRGSDLGAMARVTREIIDYLAEECEIRRSSPQNDLLTLGVQAEVDGRKLTRDELVGFCFNLFLGGLDTVSTNMSSHFRHLAERPDHQAFLRQHPERIPDAIEELMRAYAAVTTFRRCLTETKIGEVTVKPGDFVMMPTVLASNDPEVFANPEIVDFDRKPRHVSFGYGPHICIGMHLARRELRIAMEEALRILPEFQIQPGAEILSYVGGIIGPREVPLVWAAGA